MLFWRGFNCAIWTCITAGLYERTTSLQNWSPVTVYPDGYLPGRPRTSWWNSGMCIGLKIARYCTHSQLTRFRHSGAEIPNDHYSTSNVMTIRFTSDPTYTYRGFMATYYATQPKPNTTTTKWFHLAIISRFDLFTIPFSVCSIFWLHALVQVLSVLSALVNIGNLLEAMPFCFDKKATNRILPTHSAWHWQW